MEFNVASLRRTPEMKTRHNEPSELMKGLFSCYLLQSYTVQLININLKKEAQSHKNSVLRVLLLNFITWSDSLEFLCGTTRYSGRLGTVLSGTAQ